MLKVSYLLILLFGSTYCLNTSSNSIFRFTRQTRCLGDQFRCKNGQCVESFAVCDGETNCRDGTDETQAVCSKLNLQCPSFAFRCTYGACVDKHKKCDGKQDCADNSDELLPECKNVAQPISDAVCKDGEFKCLSGQCVDEFSVCDGNRDCDDGSDETITQCVNIRCPDFSFQCAYGACIDKNKRCNNVDDCSDASDEDEELCQSMKKPKPVKPKPKPPTSSQRGGCTLPDYPEGGRYIVKVCASQQQSNSKCVGGPGTVVPLNSVLSYECSRGYTLPESGRNIFCFNGAWDPEPPQCLKQCKPLVSDSMDLDCFYRGDPVRCDRPINPGTKVRPRCKVAYHISDPSVSFIETECQADGTWEVPLFRCVPDCGKPNANVERPLISYGTKTEIGEYPWHAGLYLRIKGVWEHACGGTIISPYIILTAAHCVYDEALEKVRIARDMKVAVGKYRRAWNLVDKYEQRLDVKEVIPQRAYRGKSNSYEQDIAVLDLEKSIVLSTVVLPACVDWLAEGIFYLGMLGTVVGWGLNQFKTPTDSLEMTRLPYYDYDSCRRESPPEFLRFITYDKFCAGYSNGTGVQPGDSGGGLTFVRNKQHYVYGIVSLKLRNEDTFAAFTNVTEHIDWLENVVKALKPHHTN
ncbi:modular serine protease-like [Rhodnius prolixus]|uniref:modular serine protease-like n=1 Tax=Rhodnius prolixus TaxID=13249 RepID=UPI003D18E38D